MDVLSTCPMTKNAITTLNKAVEESAFEICRPEVSDLTEMSKPILICVLGDLEVAEKQKQDSDGLEANLLDKNSQNMRKRVLERLA